MGVTRMIYLMKKLLLLTLIGLATFPETALAQWGVGASFERRDQAPANGYGIQFERDVFRIPVIFLRTRIHASYFKDTEYEPQFLPIFSPEPSTIEAYDFGGTVLAGLRFGLFNPYAGVGAGAEQWDFRPDGAASQQNNTAYFYGLLGVSISALPILEPYMEYRFSNFQDVDSAAQKFREAKGRFHIGVTLRF